MSTDQNLRRRVGGRNRYLPPGPRSGPAMIHGYGDRFGVIYGDFETQQRIPELSAEWFRESAHRNAVL
jgi:beta-glucosidase/6-phospho-beta-glucosidase/beta-galactosidase